MSCHTEFGRLPKAWNLRADRRLGWSERIHACYDPGYMTINQKHGGKR